MLSYCLKCRINTENKNPRVAKTKKKQCFYQIAQCVITKNRNLSNNKKVVDYGVAYE